MDDPVCGEEGDGSHIRAFGEEFIVSLRDPWVKHSLSGVGFSVGFVGDSSFVIRWVCRFVGFTGDSSLVGLGSGGHRTVSVCKVKYLQNRYKSFEMQFSGMDSRASMVERVRSTAESADLPGMGWWILLVHSCQSVHHSLLEFWATVGEAEGKVDWGLVR